ncbi:MAG: hypothetical protein ACOYOL_11745 [Chthoniobacterales bacterium]
MALDLSKLENVHEAGSKTLARCPACAELGLDESGNHLFIRHDGKFGCVLNPGTGGRGHRKRIFALVGVPTVPCRPRYKIALRVPEATPAVASTAYGPLNFPKVPPVSPQPALPSAHEGFPSELQTLVAQTACDAARSASLPDFLLRSPVRSMEYSDPNFKDTPDGSLILELAFHKGCLSAHVLYADPGQHCFWDCETQEHVRPPRFYLLICQELGFDPMSGFPMKNGAICPF